VEVKGHTKSFDIEDKTFGVSVASVVVKMGEKLRAAQ